MTVVLKRSQDVEHDQVADVEVGRSRVEAELHTQGLAARQAGPQMVFHVDLDRPLPQALEECPAHCLRG